MEIRTFIETFIDTSVKFTHQSVQRAVNSLVLSLSQARNDRATVTTLLNVIFDKTRDSNQSAPRCSVYLTLFKSVRLLGNKIVI